MEEQSYSVENKTTLTQQIIQNRIAQIYNDLRSLGFHQFLKSEFDSSKKPAQLLSIYFQPTASRQNIIQWLISLGFAQYKEQPQYNVPLSRTLTKTKKLMSSIWKMGLMPFSKHTKTMDYEKYVQGMLGFENSVKLIYDLVKFARKSKHLQLKKSQMQQNEQTFGALLNQLFLNFQTLVNQDYDPYGITFPGAYNDVDEAALNKKFQQISQDVKLMQQQNCGRHYEQQKQNDKLNKLFESAQKHSNQFDQKYGCLLTTINGLRSDPNNQIFFSKGNKQTSISPNSQRSVSVQKRRLNISLSLCQKVKQLKKVRKLRELSQTSNLKIMRQQLQAVMNEANQNIVF